MMLDRSVNQILTNAHLADACAAKALNYAGACPVNWVPERTGIDWDVAIVGGGQTGQAIAFALRRAGISRITVIDAEKCGQAGLWRARARMDYLRTPKTLPGPELDIGGLSFRAWYEAIEGESAYQKMERIPRLLWIEYLDWYERITTGPIRFESCVTRVEGAGDALDVHILENGIAKVERARKVVLATGIAGSGKPLIPDVLKHALPSSLYAHSHDRIDFTRLNGHSVAVLGAGASAFDAANAALRAGAREVHMYCRRADLSRFASQSARAYPGAIDNFTDIPDEDRWSLALALYESGTPPPLDSVLVATEFPNFTLHLNAPWSGVEVCDGRVVSHVQGEKQHFDFVIAATGYSVDLAAREELRTIAPYAARWSDIYTPPLDQENKTLGLYPYLGGGYELRERHPGTAPYISNIHCFNVAASLSFGRPVGDIPSLNKGVPRLVETISRDLFVADYALHRQRMHAEVQPLFEQELYAAALHDRRFESALV